MSDDRTPNATTYDRRPRRFVAGCYFPDTDLCVTNGGRRGTGIPGGVEWIDSPADLPWYRGARPLADEVEAVLANGWLSARDILARLPDRPSDDAFVSVLRDLTNAGRIQRVTSDDRVTVVYRRSAPPRWSEEAEQEARAALAETGR
jgi:hypothetical protein